MRLYEESGYDVSVSLRRSYLPTGVFILCISEVSVLVRIRANSTKGDTSLAHLGTMLAERDSILTTEVNLCTIFAHFGATLTEFGLLWSTSRLAQFGPSQPRTTLNTSAYMCKTDLSARGISANRSAGLSVFFAPIRGSCQGRQG